MPRENVELVRHAFQAYNARGIDGALPYFARDVVWYTTDRWLDGSAYRGHDGMRSLTAAFTENFDDLRFEIRDLRDAGDRVVAQFDMTARIKNAGDPISQRLGLIVSDFCDGAFGEIRVLPSWQEALKAVGLEE